MPISLYIIDGTQFPIIFFRKGELQGIIKDYMELQRIELDCIRLQRGCTPDSRSN